MRFTNFIPRFLLGCLLCLNYPCVAQAKFESENKKALESNPPGVDVVLQTEGGRSEFHLFETIPIELDFSSSHPLAYSIELDEVMNFAGQANRFKVFPSDTVFLPSPIFSNGGAICCASDKRYLSSRPTTLRRELTDYLRFEKRGLCLGHAMVEIEDPYCNRLVAIAHEIHSLYDQRHFRTSPNQQKRKNLQAHSLK